MTTDAQRKRRSLHSRNTSQWARTRERGSYTGMRLLVWLYRHGGDRVLAPVLYMVVFYFFATRRATRRHSRLYLRRVISGKVGIWQVWRHHLTFGRALMGRVRAWMGRLPVEALDFPQCQVMRGMKKRGQGVIFLGTHLGNLDVCRTLVQPDESYQLNIIVHTRHAEKFNQLLAQVNPQNRVNLIQVDQITPETAMLLQTKLAQGEAIVLLADRVPEGTEARRYTTRFLGSEAHFPMGPFWLSVLLEAPVYFMTSVATASGYQLIVEPLQEQASRVTRRQREPLSHALFCAYVAQLEKLCRRYPLQWFNFYDFWLEDSKKFRE